MMGTMAVREDCRHYLKRSTPTGEAVERCRLNVNESNPFACPEGCLFFEPRNVSSAGWTQAPTTEPLSNTGRGLIALPDPPSKRGKKGKKKDR
jgi:hypothetical protein